MGVFSDPIRVSGSHVAAETTESFGVSLSAMGANRGALVSAAGTMVGSLPTGSEVRLNISHFTTGTTNPSGTEHPEATVTIRPGMTGEQVADEVLRAFRATGMNDAEATLATRAVIGSMRAESTRTHQDGQATSMFVRVARQGGLAEYAAR